MHILAAYCLKWPVVIIHENGICHCSYNHNLKLTTTAMSGLRAPMQMRSSQEYVYWCHSDLNPHFLHPPLVHISSLFTLFYLSLTYVRLLGHATIVLCLATLRSVSSRVKLVRRFVLNARLVAMVPALHAGTPISFAVPPCFLILSLLVVMEVCFYFIVCVIYFWLYFLFSHPPWHQLCWAYQCWDCSAW